MRSNKNLVFLGMMGSGKTTLGKIVSKKLNKEFIDIDQLIEIQEGMTISDIFQKKGESFFRKFEERISIQNLKKSNSVILYTIVDTGLAKHLAAQCLKNNIPCFGVLGNLILSFSKLLNQKAIHKPSAQHVLDEDYYKRIEAIQFTMTHDDGKKNEDVERADIILLGVSRTSKTPTSIYLANRGFKTLNCQLVLDQKIPDFLKTNNKLCVIGLTADPERLAEIRKTRANTNNNIDLKLYTNVEKIKEEVDSSKIMFKKFNWPTIDVTRRSVEETAASIIKIYEIKKNK